MSKNYELLDQIEAQVRDETTIKHSSEISHLNDLLDVFINGFNTVGNYTVENNHKDAWLLLLPRSYRALRSSLILLQTAYYPEALAVLRTVTENWLIAKDCKNNQSTINILIKGKDKNGKTSFNYKNIAQSLGVTDVIYDGDYAYLSCFVHANRRSVMILLNKEQKEIIPYPIYDELLFMLCCEMFIRSGRLMIELFGQFLGELPNVSKEKLQEWCASSLKCIRSTDEWLKYIREHYVNNEN